MDAYQNYCYIIFIGKIKLQIDFSRKKNEHLSFLFLLSSDTSDG